MMNKRIKKKRRKLSNWRLGDNEYTVKEIRKFHLIQIIRSLTPYFQCQKEYKISARKVKKLANYIYRTYRVIDYSKIARPKIKPEFLYSNDTSSKMKYIKGGQTIRYNSSTFIHLMSQEGFEDGSH